MWPGQLLVVNYHKVMSDPYGELKRSLAFLLEGSSNSTAAAADVRLEPGELPGAEGQEGGGGAGALIKAPGIVTHPASEQMLQESQEVFKKLEALYALHNARLRELLVELGQEQAMHNATHVFPDSSVFDPSMGR
jgi:hypothetical protein